MDSLFFYFLSACVLYTSFRVVTHKNPVYGALYLAAAMIALAGLFFLLDAPFIAAVQLIIYAGAVLVLFVMVLMLMNLNKLVKPKFSLGKMSLALFFLGLILGVSLLQNTLNPDSVNRISFSVQDMAELLFQKRLLVFELFGLLLLFVAVGVIILTRLDED